MFFAYKFQLLGLFLKIIYYRIVTVHLILYFRRTDKNVLNELRYKTMGKIVNVVYKKFFTMSIDL